MVTIGPGIIFLLLCQIRFSIRSFHKTSQISRELSQIEPAILIFQLNIVTCVYGKTLYYMRSILKFI